MFFKSQLPVEEKYRLYEESVQSHEGDIEFINERFQEYYQKAPLSLREDFGGTGLLACSWTRQGPKHQAVAIDLDPEPINYGMKKHYAALNDGERQRMKYIKGNVLDDHNFKTDVIVAFNFSYFIFKKRSELLQYFQKVRRSLNNQGVFFLDIFGGTEARSPLEEETEHDDHSYYWDCEKYNPITNECLYKIHFKNLAKNKKYEDVFVYDWRLWTIAEIREILQDAGFGKTISYWEGVDEEDGSGDGNFYQTEEAENCESWVTYIAALP